MPFSGTARLHQTTELWAKNSDGARTVAQARAIAEDNGVYIADDVHIVSLADEKYDATFGDSYASYGHFDIDPRTSSNPTIMWNGRGKGFSMLDQSGKINVFMRQSVLESDRAITAILGHETYEIEKLRSLFSKSGGGMPYSSYVDHVRPGKPDNVHANAVDFGDGLVWGMIKEGR